MLVLCDVEEIVLVDGRGGPLALELEDHDTVVVARSEEVDLGMGGDDPETVVFALEGLDRCPLIQIPDSERLVLADGQDEILMRVEQTPRSILKVATASVDFPGLGVAHPPQLDQSVVAGRNNEGQGWVERDPVDTSVMALEDKLDNGIGVAKHVGLVGIGAGHLVLERHRSGSRVLLAQTRNVPHSDRLIERGRDDEIVLWVELGAHGVVVVAGHGAYCMEKMCQRLPSASCYSSDDGKHGENCLTQRSVLPVPYSDGLIVGTRDDPRELVVEEDGAHIIEMATEGEETSPRLQRPDLDLVVVASGDEERLCLVEVDAAHRAVVLFEAVDESSHAVVP